MNFADNIYAGKGFPMAVGIDPHLDLIPTEYLPAEGDISTENLKEGIQQWMTDVLEVFSPLVRVVKFQSAFFEQFGSLGVGLLAQGIAVARNQGLVTILDCKRGDIGSTAEAYAAYLRGGVFGRRRFKSDMEVDSVTINPFLGPDTLQPFADVLGAKGIFVLVRTSNPGSAEYQTAERNGATVAETIGEHLENLANSCRGTCGFSSVGAVVGATYPEELVKLRDQMPSVLFLIPGVGAQGGSVDTIKNVVDSKGRGALVSVSRGVTFPDVKSGTTYKTAVQDACRSYIDLLQFK